MGLFDFLTESKQKTKTKFPEEARRAISIEQPLFGDVLQEERTQLASLLPFLTSPFGLSRGFPAAQPLVQARQTAQRATGRAGREMGLTPELLGPLLTELEGLDPELRRQLLQLIAQRAQGQQGILRAGSGQSLVPSQEVSTSSNLLAQGAQLGEFFGAARSAFG
jgi:hypothetical protein